MNEEILILAGVNLNEGSKSTTCDDCSKKEQMEFFEKRKEGARAIANMAKAKGGPSTLTYYHFHAKDPLYRQVIDAIRNERPKNYYKNKYDQIMSRLHRTKFDEKDFQELTGELEVWGEALSVLF